MCVYVYWMHVQISVPKYCMYELYLCVWSCSRLYNVLKFFLQSVKRQWTWSSCFSQSQLIIVRVRQFENLLAAVHYIWEITSNVSYSLQSCMLHFHHFCLKALIHTVHASVLSVPSAATFSSPQQRRKPHKPQRRFDLFMYIKKSLFN